ncbi:MAG: outer membrane protein assembly factor BamD [Ignavibacteriaceae bacterium]
MKYSLIVLVFGLILWGCATTFNTSNMSASERLDYAIKLYNNHDYEQAVKEFQGIVLQFPGNAVVDSAQFYLGQTRFQRGEYILAAYEFSKLIKNMPSSHFVADAQYMLADSYYLLSPNYALDQKYTKKAIEEFQAFIDFFPTNSKVAEAEKKIGEMNEKLAHKEYHTAYIYERMEYYTAALKYYDLVLDIYHDTKYAPMALYAKIKLLIERNHNDEASIAISNFIERYQNDKNIKEVEKIKASLQNKISASK